MMTANHDALLAFVASLSRRFDVEIASDTPLFTSGLIDSLSFLQVVHFVESNYGVRVSLAELVPENWDTPARIVAYIQTQEASHDSGGVGR